MTSVNQTASGRRRWKEKFSSIHTPATTPIGLDLTPPTPSITWWLKTRWISYRWLAAFDDDRVVRDKTDASSEEKKCLQEGIKKNFSDVLLIITRCHEMFDKKSQSVGGGRLAGHDLGWIDVDDVTRVLIWQLITALLLPVDVWGPSGWPELTGRSFLCQLERSIDFHLRSRFFLLSD